MDWDYFKKKLVECWTAVWIIVFAISISKLLLG